VQACPQHARSAMLQQLCRWGLLGEAALR
jgi:hypothetical protein